MTSRLRAFASVRAVVAAVGLSVVAAWALADSGGGGANCCYTKTCQTESGTESATDCLGYNCVAQNGSGWRCSGHGGCDPVWAEAWCLSPQPLGSN